MEYVVDMRLADSGGSTTPAGGTQPSGGSQ
jgi:hypothetical protein